MGTYQQNEKNDTDKRKPVHKIGDKYMMVCTESYHLQRPRNQSENNNDTQIKD